MKTVVKFFKNENNKLKKSGGNRIASATCGKVMVADSEWQDDHPNESYQLSDGFWEVDIIREVWPGYQKGCFVCRPIKQIESSPISLMPNSFDVSFYNGLLIVIPKFDILQAKEKDLFNSLKSLENNITACDIEDEKDKLIKEYVSIKAEYDKTRFYWNLPVKLRQKWKLEHPNIYAIIVASEYRENMDYIDFHDIDVIFPGLKKFSRVNEALKSILKEEKTKSV